MTSGSLWNYYRDEVNDATNENTDNNNINNSKTTTSKSIECKTKIIGRIPNDDNTLDTEVVVPLKFVSNFWRLLDLPLINCEIELDLSWSEECIIPEISITPRVVGNPDANASALTVAAIQTTGGTFQINNTKPYVQVCL